VFVLSKPVQHNLIPVSISVKHISVDSHKHYARPERLDRDKHSSLLQKLVNYGRTKFYKNCSWSHWDEFVYISTKYTNHNMLLLRNAPAYFGRSSNDVRKKLNKSDLRDSNRFTVTSVDGLYTGRCFTIWFHQIKIIFFELTNQPNQLQKSYKRISLIA
jgi:hypothetical protein